jgi:serine protease Do
MQGNCIGINTAILSGGSGGNQGIGFAIPINMARHVMDEIMKNGKVVRGYLGVYIQPLTPDLAKQFGLGQGGGALVNEVTPDAPASKAGIVRGDVILELDGKPVRTTNDLQVRISQEAPGTVVHLKVLHDGKTRDVAVKLGELPEKETAENGGATASSALDGVRVQALTADIAQQLNLPPGTRGVVVVSVDPSSNAADAGLTRGDVIQEVNHKQINNEQDYSDALSSAGKNPVLLLINRGGNTLYLVVQP